MVNQVSAENPTCLLDSMSASNLGFILRTTGSESTVGPLSALSAAGHNAFGILYTLISNASAATLTLSSGWGTTFNVDPLYHTKTAAIYWTDHSSTLFTINTSYALSVATSAMQALSSTGATFDNRGPRERRRAALEFK